MSQFTTNFQYDIRDIVYMKTATHNATSTPRKFMIVERLAQECPNGIQLHYKLHPPTESGTVLEICISKKMPPYEPMDTHWYGEGLRIERDIEIQTREAMKDIFEPKGKGDRRSEWRRWDS